MVETNIFQHKGLTLNISQFRGNYFKISNKTHKKQANLGEQILLPYNAPVSYFQMQMTNETLRAWPIPPDTLGDGKEPCRGFPRGHRDGLFPQAANP